MSTILTNVDPSCPVWEVSNFNLPDFDTDNLIHKTFEQVKDSEKHTNSLRQVCEHPYENFATEWRNNCIDIQRMLNDCTLPVVESMWFNHLKNWEWPLEQNCNVEILLDKPKFYMPSHIDNRFVLGVLIINLQDNPCSTVFNDIHYTGPKQKGTGVFMLNHINTMHSISNFSTQNRLVGYQTITINGIA